MSETRNLLTDSLLVVPGDEPSYFPVPTYLNWSSDSAFALNAVFHLDGNEIHWQFERDLIIEAVNNGVAGIGDVQFVTDGHKLTLFLNSPEGAAVLICKKAVFHQFVWDTLELVPLGQETVDVDSFLAELFS